MKKIIFGILLSFLCHAWTVSAMQCADDQKNEQQSSNQLKWYRNSAEKNALYHQSYAIAMEHLKNWIQHTHPCPKTWGVVLDIDDTALDNSWFMHEFGFMPENIQDFSRKIVFAEKSTAEPGVAEFLNTVHHLGGYVSFVSNRDGSYNDEYGNTMQSTIRNLNNQKLYFDQIVIAHHAHNKNPYDKNPRFVAIATGHYNPKIMVISNVLPPHKIVAYFGDNIQDFPKLQQASVIRQNINSPIYKKFGFEYYVFPNPLYGSWLHNEDK